MQRTLLVLLLVFLAGVLVLSCGCTSMGDPDEQFRDAWNQSEAALQPVVTNITRMADEQDFEGLADEVETAIATIDEHQATISRIRVSETFTLQKEQYLEGLKELRSAWVQLKDIDEKSMIDQAIDLYIAEQHLDTATAQLDEVRSMMQ
ncbi:MAG TPA: hypothetical protein PLV96_06850 [Methanoregulaceae archaeon]|nr:hypothetical protein [Methanoregulaceae archaeon]HPX73833.1 hypothetical protein [Methanoregulaceae archaeon]HQA80500.1 hypothetical protein [Methanoregulaceae archaeon]